MAEVERNVFVLEPRRQPPQGRFNLVAAVAVALVASLAYVVALTVGPAPSPTVAAAMFTAAPLLCLVALVVYWASGREPGEAAVRWAGGGLAVCFTALTLQYISFPTVSSGGGPLRTDVQSSAALYLLFHLALYAAAAAGAAQAPTTWVRSFVVTGCVLSFALAGNLVPLPLLIVDSILFTPLLTAVEIALAVLGGFATLAWAARAGQSTTPLAGWFAVALALSVADVVLNAATGSRFDPVWWSSLSLRVATFTVLAFGGLAFLLRDRKRFAGYTESELLRRESQLTVTGRITDALMANAVLLSRASSPGDVADALADSVRALTGCPRVLVIADGAPNGMVLLASRGYDEASLAVLDQLLHNPGTAASGLLHRERSFYAVGGEAIHRGCPLLAGIPADSASARMAVLPMLAAGVVRGMVAASADVVREWNDTDRAVLGALAAQGGPALARAAAHEQEHHNAEVLQRSLLPPSLPTAPGLQIACRYLPGDSAATVGGDWYDVEVLPDERVLLTVGDVVGKGIRAAAVMGMLRQSARALARVEPNPATVFDRLDGVSAELGDSGFATVLGVLFEPSTGSVTLSSAGHPPALHAGSDAAVTRLDAALAPPIGTPLGPRPQHTVPVAAGDYLVLYTDGLVESRGRTIDDGIAELMRGVQHAVSGGMSPEELAEHVLTLRRHTDDVALVVARVREDGTTTRRPAR